MEHDATDILGQDTMPSASRAHNALFSLSLGQFIGISVIFFAVYVFGLRLWRRVLLWRERSYKLATRRRHGIPDSDMRPFNVAYAEAAMRAREESELPAKPGPAPLASVVDLGEASYEQNLRNRSVPQRPEGGMRSTVMPPGGYLATPAPSYSSSYAMNGVATSHNNLYLNLQSESNPQFVQDSRPLNRQQEYYNIQNTNGSSNGIEDKKRPFDDSMDEEHNTKKSRVDEDAVMDSDVDADEEFHKRGAKRGLQDDTDDHPSHKKNRGKRARNGERTDASMDVDSEEGDEVTELRSIARGKKRDRAEAGSTFGADDDDSMDEANGDSKARRHRKRRTVAKRKSEASYQRGKKRDRGSDDEELSDGSHSSSPGRKLARTKRGKRTSRYAHSVKDDVSMDGSMTSGNKIRCVGDEWESGGIQYKIGPNYQRLRQALVKKARHRFLMPQDSQHPDRQEHLQVYVETWLTEEEYKEAKDQHLLAWQDDSPSRSELKDNLTIDVTHANSNIPGKSLLWGNSATTTPTLSPAPPSPTSDAGTLDSVKHRGGSRHPLAVTTSVPAITHIPTAKRIASASQVLSSSTASSPLGASVNASPAPGLSDSTNAIGSPRTPNKVFSKWEKQELEARAMMKIREANKRKELEREAKRRAEREAAERAEEEKKRQRQEGERVEREQREASERARKEAQEKAEVEKKAKEAADAAQKSSSVPKITVTAPSTGLGSQPSQSGTPASAVPPGTTGATFFAMPSNLSATPSPFSAPKPAAAIPNNPFISSAPGAAKTDAKPPASPGFSFGTAPSTTATNTSVSAPGADAGSKTESQGATSGNPLFARLGMPAVPAATSESAKPASNPMLSFANSKPSTFTAPTPSIQTTAGASADSTATTTPKFNFGFGAKSVAPMTGNTNAAPKTDTPAAPGLGSAFGSNTSTGASGTTASSSPFLFKVPEAPSSATNNGSSPAAANSGFKFGSTSSAFGTTSVFPSSTSASGQANTTAKSPFGTPSTFGSGAESKPSPFGTSATQTQNGFSGAAVSKPGEAKQENKPLFSFANPVGSATSNKPSPFTPNSSNTTAAKPSFSFGAPPPANPPVNTTAAPASSAPAAPKFSFNFGAGAAATSTTTSAISPSLFGSAPSSGQNVFGGGMFGASAANPAQK